MRTEAYRWGDLWDALDAMEAGDPPLRWAIPKEEARSLAVVASTRSRKVGGYRIKTFYDSGTLWFVRLPKNQEMQTWTEQPLNC